MKSIKHGIKNNPLPFILSLVGTVVSVMYITEMRAMVNDGADPFAVVIGAVALMGFTVGMFWYWVSLYFKSLK